MGCSHRNRYRYRNRYRIRLLHPSKTDCNCDTDTDSGPDIVGFLPLFSIRTSYIYYKKHDSAKDERKSKDNSVIEGSPSTGCMACGGESTA